MNDPSIPDSDRDAAEYLRAGQRAFVVMISLTFAGFVVAQFVLRDEVLAAALGLLSIAGVGTRELYLALKLGPVADRLGGTHGRRALQSAMLRSLIPAALWIGLDLAEGRFTGRSVLFAFGIAACATAFFWWQGTRSPAGPPSATPAA